MSEILVAIADIDWLMVIKAIGVLLAIALVVLLLTGFGYDIGLPVPPFLGELSHRVLHGPYPF